MHTSAYTLTQFWWPSCDFPLLNTDQSDAHTAAKHNCDDNECPEQSNILSKTCTHFTMTLHNAKIMYKVYSREKVMR